MDESTQRSCPHCGAEVPIAAEPVEVPALAECPRCGIVLAKYRARPPGVSTARATVSRSGGRPMALWIALLGAAILFAVVSNRRDNQRGAAVTPPQTVSPRPLSEEAREPSSATGIWSQDDEPPLEAEPEPEPPTAPAAGIEATESVGYDWFENASGWGSGLELAVAKKKPIAVYFYTDWCGYCREFESELLTRVRVEELTKYLVKVRINPESGLQERQIARQYGVRGYPSFFVQAAPGASPRRIRQHKRIGGEWVLQTPDEFGATVKRAIG